MNDHLPRPAIFVDRDGTLIQEVNFLSRVSDLRFFEFTLEAVSLLKSAGFLVIVVTNQSGIGRKIFGEEQMHELHRVIQQRLNGAVDRFYFCPHLPTAGCACRKPGTEMIEAAAKDFLIDMSRSWMIGDKAIDIETGFAANIRTAMVMTGYGASDRAALKRPPDIYCPTLLDAAREIIEAPKPTRLRPDERPAA